MITLYGISGCDTVRRARGWLDERGIGYRFHDLRKHGIDPLLVGGIGYRFHDLRKHGIDPLLVGRWMAELGWENLLNRRGLVWRRLPEEVRAGIDEAAAERLILADPAIIKRPLLAMDGTHVVGFSEQRYGELFP